jgi:hypothetical protein
MKDGKFRNCRAYVKTLSDGTVRLTSYWSVVCDVNKEHHTIVFYPHYRYGATTMQHVRKFLVDLLGFYVPMSIVDAYLKTQGGTYKYNLLYKGYTVLFRSKIS